MGKITVAHEVSLVAGPGRARSFDFMTLLDLGYGDHRIGQTSQATFYTRFWIRFRQPTAGTHERFREAGLVQHVK